MNLLEQLAPTNGPALPQTPDGFDSFVGGSR